MVNVEKYKGLNVEQLTWDEIKKPLEKINRELTSVINQLSPNKKLKLYRFRYPYMTKISDRNGLNVPTKNGGVINLSHQSIPAEIRNDLSYSSLPLGLILNNSVEVYGEIGKNITTLGVFKAGVPLGLLEVLEPKKSFCIRNVWDISAGLRSAFMLPSIGDNTSHNRLMSSVNCFAAKPPSTFNHSELFSHIVHNNPNETWYVDILFFSKAWFENNKKNSKDYHWLKFYYFLHQYLFQYTGIPRNGLTFDFVWHTFANLLTEIHNKPDPYVLDTVKHLIKLSIGELPGFGPSTDDQGGPFSLVKDAYMDNYKLQYAPTIMEPQTFTGGHPIYYSLHNPTLFESTPRKRKPESIVTDLIQIKSLVNHFKTFFDEKKIYLGESLINDIIPITFFDFFHFGNNTNYFGIKNNEDIPKIDTRFILYKKQKYNFSQASCFVQNCISISKGTKENGKKTIHTQEIIET